MTHHSSLRLLSGSIDLPLVLYTVKSCLAPCLPDDRSVEAPAKAAEPIPVALQKLEVPTKEARMKLFEKMDVNRNGKISLAEFDKAVVEQFPQFNHKPALMRAYRPHHPPAPALSISNSAARGAKETESGWRHYDAFWRMP